MILIYLTTIALVAAAPEKLADYPSVFGDNDVTNDTNILCESSTCVHTASSILKRMNPSVNPCDNFYEFTCGKFVENTVIPDSRSFFTTFSIVYDQVQQQLRRSVEDGIKEDDLYAVQLTKSFYNTCINAEENRDKDLRDVLKTLGGWPVLENQSWDETNFEWIKTVYALSQMGLDDNIFFSLNVDRDETNSSRYIVKIGEASTKIVSEYISTYFKYMIDVAEFLGADKEHAKRELEDSLNFEVELWKMSLSQEELRDRSKVNNRMTVQQLEANFTGIPWQEYINEILGIEANITESEEIVVSNPNFLQEIPKLVARTPKRVLANYALWCVVRESIDFVGERASSIGAEIERTMFGIEKRPRWAKCLEVTTKVFGLAVSGLYVSQYFDANAKINAVAIIENVKNSMYQLIEKADWMDAVTKAAALEKLHAMKQYVGYPDELLNDEMVNEYYKNVNVYPDSYLQSIYSLNKFKREQELARLRKSYEETKWVLHSENVVSVNAMYDIAGNTINIAASILQGHFYDANRPNYMNYGAIGWIIGHEMTHAFDDVGSQFDKNGNLVNWWKDETREKYLLKAQCMIEQANNHVVNEVNVTLNGVIMQGEDIADHGGLKAAYHAYERLLLDNGDRELRLPGLHYTPRQMFWISAASVWCEKLRPEQAKIEAQMAMHAPGDFRVIASMSNLPEFSKDFKCSPGSFMNPVEKCSLW